MGRRHRGGRNPAHDASGYNAHFQNALGRDFQNRICRCHIAYEKSCGSSPEAAFTDDRIVLLNEEDNDAAVKKISASDKPPQFEPGEIYGITSGSFDHEDGLWKTTIRLKGDLCIYDSSHPSGHFKKIIWKKGVGLVEYASGYGAHADGYRLKRTTTAQKS